MAQVSLSKVSDDNYSIEGCLMMNTVMSIISEFNDCLKKSHSEVSIDFAGVENSDSAAVALIIAWLAEAKQNNTELHLVNLPQQIIDIAKASDLMDILHIA